ncbi:hypothetical protein QBC47DRAFT_351277 [Echria macrotheca]|uniref:Tat pathway signal sequence n=1 Tax=Echria macrotheca TaxID=438768 RepID=A0AAJ0F7L0_9PEZI|nr:hypothetical protein QBC47DRAFT_351277 [Echria macrotheca]
MPSKASVEYSPLSSSDEDRPLVHGETVAVRVRTRHTAPYRWLIVANIALFLISCTLFIFSVVALHQTGGYFPWDRNRLLKATSQPSPILDLINIPLITKRMNGSLFNTESSIYRQPPSPEVDAAWSRIQTREPIPISRADVIRLNKDPSIAAKFPPSWGYGEEAFVGKIDVFHQIHCLNTLRMNLHTNYEYYHGDKIPGRLAELHVGHCLNTLLENLMCTGNVDIYTSFWMDAQLQPFSDFNMDHKCRDFDAILAWQEKHAVPLDKYGSIRRPEGEGYKVMGKEFKKVFDWEDDGSTEDTGELA